MLKHFVRAVSDEERLSACKAQFSCACLSHHVIRSISETTASLWSQPSVIPIQCVLIDLKNIGLCEKQDMIQSVYIT